MSIAIQNSDNLASNNFTADKVRTYSADPTIELLHMRPDGGGYFVVGVRRLHSVTPFGCWYAIPHPHAPGKLALFLPIYCETLAEAELICSQRS